tara:strand:- start:5649 stop:7355 length:1707 start_codon:yes stop_codon:yes gene_type:complete
MEEQDFIKRMRNLDEEVSSSVAKRVVPRLPDSALKPNQQLDPNIRRIIVDRLVHLQYLTKRSNVNNKALTNAVRDLQAEAGLITDKWLGFQTWQAIQQVFSFEEPTHLERWIIDHKPSDFIVRAAYVRLRALGIIEGSAVNFSDKYNATDAPIERKYAVDNGLAKFRDILLLLGYDKDKLLIGEGYHLGLFEVLFNHDQLIELMFHKRISIQNLLKAIPLYSKKKDTNYQLKCHALRFLCYLCKVELWLHDYGNSKTEIDADGSIINPNATKISFSRYLETRRRIKDWRDINIAGFLSAAIRFCSDSGTNKKQLFCMGKTISQIKRGIAEYRISHIDIALDVLTCAVPSITVEIPKQIQAERLLKALRNERYDQKLDDTNTWENIGFGNAILDGVKRVWRFAKEVISWIINSVSKMLKSIKRRMSQVIRIAKKFAFEGLAILQRAYIAIDMGTKLLLNEEVPCNDEFVKMRKDIDMDFTLAISQNATASHTTLFVTRLTKYLQAFEFSIVLVKAVLKAIFLVVKVYAAFITGPLAVISKLLTIERFLEEHECKILHRTLFVSEHKHFS